MERKALIVCWNAINPFHSTSRYLFRRDKRRAVIMTSITRKHHPIKASRTLSKQKGEFRFFEVAATHLEASLRA
jgi:hypothetical protein